MCETITIIAIAALALSAAGTAVTVEGQMAAGKAAQQQADYQSGIAANNAILSKRAADAATQKASVDEANKAVAGKILLGQERSTLASNGVDDNSGSAEDIQTDTAGLNKLDQLTVRNTGAQVANNFLTQGMNYTAQSQLDEAAGANAANAADTSAFGSSLSGAGSVASKWYDYSNAGVFNSTPTPTTLANSGYNGFVG